jgi:hypothetical protein
MQDQVNRTCRCASETWKRYAEIVIVTYDVNTWSYVQVAGHTLYVTVLRTCNKP